APDGPGADRAGGRLYSSIAWQRTHVVGRDTIAVTGIEGVPMKSALLAAAVGGVVLAAGLAPQSLPVVAAQAPAKEAPPETLPEPPKLDPKNNHVALDKDRTFLMEQ